MNLSPAYSVTTADAYHREQLTREFQAARESMATVRRMLSLVTNRRSSGSGHAVRTVPATH